MARWVTFSHGAVGHSIPYGGLLLLLSLLGCVAVDSPGPRVPTAWEQEVVHLAQVNYESRVQDWMTRVQTWSREMQIIQAHPSLPKLAKAVQEENARALVQGRSPDIVQALASINPSAEEVQLLVKLASLAEQGNALQQEAQRLDAERQRRLREQSALDAQAQLQQQRALEQARATQQTQAALLYWLMHRR